MASPTWYVWVDHPRDLSIAVVIVNSNTQLSNPFRIYELLSLTVSPFQVKASFNGSVEIANAYKYPFIRFFTVKRGYTDNTPKIGL